jgi:hypothetical protein
MNELEAAKKRGYIVFTISQRTSSLGPCSRWCSETLQPQIYVLITGKGGRTEMDLIFIKFDEDKVRETMHEAIQHLYQANSDERFVQQAFATFSPGVIYNTAKCKTVEQAEKIAQGYVEIYRSIILPNRIN